MMTSCHKEIRCHNKESLPRNNKKLPGQDLFTYKDLSSQSEILFHNNDLLIHGNGVLSFTNGIISHNNEVLSHNDKRSHCFAFCIRANATEVRDAADSKQTQWIPLLNATLNMNLQIANFLVVLEESPNIEVRLQQPALVETKEDR